MSPKPVRVAIHLRVSNDDGFQEIDNQFFQRRKIYQDLGHDPEMCPYSSGHAI